MPQAPLLERPPAKREVWCPQPGSQVLFVSCPIFEVLYEGTRGPGKTDALLMDFAQHVGQGFGPAWRGVIFRRTYKQLDDIVAKTRLLFRTFFEGARFNASDFVWTWPTGEQLLLRHMDRIDDYWNYHGHEYPWIGWEELTNWPTDACYEAMKSCSRSSHPGMPRKVRATCNPYGVGHNWVKKRFVSAAKYGGIITENGMQRVRIHGTVFENKALLAADPDYPNRLAADSNEARRKAWLDGSWDIASGGMFDDLLDRKIHEVPQFVPPSGWHIMRSLDWGESAPFSLGWWAMADGTDVRMPDGSTRSFVRGSLIRLAEWYGWSGKENEGLRLTGSAFGKRALQMEADMGLRGRVRPGPADTQIWNVQNGTCIGEDLGRLGLHFERANKGPGSRKNGWSLIRARLEASIKGDRPGLFVMEGCQHFWRTMENLPRAEDDPDDIDDGAEDHLPDEVRYAVMADPPRVVSDRELML